MEQRVTSPDEEETHVDQFVLQTWECAPERKESLGYLWRGIEAKQIAGDDLDVQGHSGSERDVLHLNSGPRIPSAIAGILCTTGAVLEPITSTVRHQLIMETTYSIYEQNDEGVWSHGQKLVCSFKRDVTIADCSIARPNVETPKYITTSQEENVDPVKFLELYNEITTPKSFSVTKVSSVLEENKLVGKPKYHSKLMTANQVRRHQLETNSFCLCFFEEIHNDPPPGSAPELDRYDRYHGRLG